MKYINIEHSHDGGNFSSKIITTSKYHTFNITVVISREREQHGSDVQTGAQHLSTLEALIISAGTTDSGEMNHSL